MKRYSYYHGPFLSFFSKEFYRDVGQNWKGIGYLYMAILLAILWIPSIIAIDSSFRTFAEKDAGAFTKQLPKITIKNGQVSTDVETPYFIKDPKNNSTVGIIDLTGQYRSLDDTEAHMLLTKNKLIMKGDHNDTKIYDLTPVQDFYVDSARVDGWLTTARQWMIPIFYPLGLLSSFIFRAIQILVYALIGMAFASMLKVQLSYPVLMRLAAVALTPVLVLDIILEFSPVKIPFWTILGIIVGLGYLMFAINANASTETQPPYPPPYAPPL
ncbi:MAG TPA: DUF1189 family protein [Pyrinomonadaceae bacterium]|jgi:hypothetical protein|nr:DUF1189 family protein [Pyrinomonadaceae bacterium]